MRNLVVDSLTWIGQVLGFSSSSATTTPVSEVSPPVAETSCTTSTFADSPLDTYAMYATADNLFWMGGLIGLTLIGGLAYGLYCYYTTPPAAPGAAAETLPQAPVSSDPLLVQEPAPVFGEVAQENVQATLAQPPILVETSSQRQCPPLFQEAIIRDELAPSLVTSRQLAIQDVDEIFSQASVVREASRLYALPENVAFNRAIYSPQAFSLDAVHTLINNTSVAIAKALHQLQGTPQQIARVPQQEIIYLSTIIEETVRRLEQYDRLLVTYWNDPSTVSDGSLQQCVLAAKECNLFALKVLDQADAMADLYDKLVEEVGQGAVMQLVEGGAPVVTFLEPCLGVSLSASLNLLLLRFTGSRRLSAPRVSLSLGGLGLSLATSTLLLSLGQPLLVALAAAVVLRLVVVLALRYRYAWFRQN